MNVDLDDEQIKAINNLKSGSILRGGVGSGKTRVSIAYYFLKVCRGKMKINNVGGVSEMKTPKNLFIITTAMKRDSLEWEQELAPFSLSTRDDSFCGVQIKVDSWNNIHKYCDIKNSFFIFDEQRLVGSGAWVKSFQKIVKRNEWILLSATPGDTWSDYIPVFVANGFYKNRTEFLRTHAVYSRFTTYPKIEKYIETGKLIRFRDSITVVMPHKKTTISTYKDFIVEYDKEIYDLASVKRWNPYKDKPIKNASELCYTLRKIVNSNTERLCKLEELQKKHDRIIVFYNFDYELEILRDYCKQKSIMFGERNGHVHDKVPSSDVWLYLVQYTAGAEAWNCITTNAMLFYSLNYSYKIMVQASGRIDRRNTQYKELFYYTLKSSSSIDSSISKSIHTKKIFNVKTFAPDLPSH